MIRREFLYLIWYLLICIPIIIIYIKFSAKAWREWLILIGQIKPKVISDEEKREYIRLESTFPVEFQKIEKDMEFNIHQGFTRDISKAGMSVETITVRGKKLEDLVPNETKLKLIINIPSEAQAIIAQATVRWVRKIEDMAVDRYLIGVSYDDIAEPDLKKIVRYALWFRRKPDIVGIMVVIISMLIAAFFVTFFIIRTERTRLQTRLRIQEEERVRLLEEAEEIRREKEEKAKDLETLAQRYTTLQERLEEVEMERKEIPTEEKKMVSAPETPREEVIEEAMPEVEEIEPEEALEPVVEARKEIAPKDEIIVEPNITRGMIESEKDVYKTFRDYILKEDIQLLDRYASLHRTSIYHPASLFALAELRYKNGHIKEMTIKAYRDVIRLYPRSKYASYASHRLEQINRNLPYETYSLRYYHTEYNLPPLFDYRELEPYKE